MKIQDDRNIAKKGRHEVEESGCNEAYHIHPKVDEHEDYLAKPYVSDCNQLNCFLRGERLRAGWTRN